MSVNFFEKTFLKIFIVMATTAAAFVDRPKDQVIMCRYCSAVHSLPRPYIYPEQHCNGCGEWLCRVHNTPTYCRICVGCRHILCSYCQANAAMAERGSCSCGCLTCRDCLRIMEVRHGAEGRNQLCINRSGWVTFSAAAPF